MSLRERIERTLQRVLGPVTAGAEEPTAKRKTTALPSIFPALMGPYRPGNDSLPKPTPVNLRKFAETPAPRRAINIIKDRVASMDWQVRLKRGISPASVPVAGEVVSVFYRVPARSRARLASTTSIASEGSDGLPGVARWLGKIEQPLTRSSADCENAAAAMLVFSTNPTATWSGNYTGVNLQMGADVWPGDVLSLPQPSGAALDVIVRTIKIICRANGPEVMEYTVAFANDWAEGLSLKLSESISTDVILPQSAESAPGGVLSNLQQLQVSSISTTAIGINAGVAPPSGGGFEVRRRDWDFGAGVDQDLVLRSPVQNFTIPRAAQVEQYFIRMYDGSNPPVYSRFSSAVFTNVPV